MERRGRKEDRGRGGMEAEGGMEVGERWRQDQNMHARMGRIHLHIAPNGGAEDNFAARLRDLAKFYYLCILGNHLTMEISRPDIEALRQMLAMPARKIVTLSHLSLIHI